MSAVSRKPQGRGPRQHCPMILSLRDRSAPNQRANSAAPALIVMHSDPLAKLYVDGLAHLDQSRIPPA